MIRRGFALAGLAALLALAAATASAKGQLQVRPTQVEIPAGAPAGRLVLANTGDRPLTAQVRVFLWTQADGSDRLAKTDVIQLSPPIVQLAPGAEQLVRIVRLGPAPTSQDDNYRLVVDELPSADAPSGTGISLRMRYVLPLYVRAAQATAVKLQCHVSGAVLACDNQGTRAAQLGASKLLDGKGQALALTEGLLGYVLPGSHQQWPLDAKRLATLTADLRLETQLNGQPVSLAAPRAP